MVVKGGLLFRVTFAKSVAERIAREIGGSVERADLKRGRPLAMGESTKGLYGIVDCRRDRLLRVATDPSVAKILADDPSRKVCEVFLVP